MGFPFDADASADTNSGPRNIPEGDYEFRVHELPKHSITSTNRNMLTMKLVIDDGEYSGKSIRFNLVFIPKGEPNHSMTIRALKAFGIDHDGSLQINEEDFLDKLVRAHVRVKNEKYVPKGQTDPVTIPKSEIGWFLDEGEVSKSPTSTPNTSKAKVTREQDEVPF